MLHRYNPMREPQKELTHDDMWKTLAKHGASRADVEVRPAEPAGPHLQPPAALVWQKPVHTKGLDGKPNGTGYCISVCGQFVIAKVKMGPEIVYTASKRRDGFPAAVLGSVKSFEEAKAVCERAR